MSIDASRGKIRAVSPLTNPDQSGDSCGRPRAICGRLSAVVPVSRISLYVGLAWATEILGPEMEKALGSGTLRPSMARPERLELPTPRFVVWCSIQLSYGRSLCRIACCSPALRTRTILIPPAPRKTKNHGQFIFSRKRSRHARVIYAFCPSRGGMRFDVDSVSRIGIFPASRREP